MRSKLLVISIVVGVLAAINCAILPADDSPPPPSSSVSQPAPPPLPDAPASGEIRIAAKPSLPPLPGAPAVVASAKTSKVPPPVTDGVGVKHALPLTDGAGAAKPAAPSAPSSITVTPPPVSAPRPAAAEIIRNDQGEPLITNVFADTDIRQALSDVANQAGVTIIPDSTVQGTVSADLKDVPLERALNMLLLAGGLSYARQDGYYLVGAPDPSNPNFYLLCKSELVELNHATPQMVMTMLGGAYGRYLSGEGITPPTTDRDRQQNRNDYRTIPPTSAPAPAGGCRILITAPPQMIPRIKADIALLDRAPTQVMLEAVVLEVSEDALKNIGVDWATRWIRFSTDGNGSIGNNGTTSLSYSQVSNTEMVTLTAMVEKGKARLRANPRVATAEGQTAELEVGKETYFAIVTGPVTFPYTTLEQIKSGILLRITPRVNEAEREISAKVEPEVRDVTGQGPNGLPEITFRRASTNIRVKDGQSIVIGGLISEFSTKTQSKMPILGDLPLLGHLFRRINSQETKTEVVIILTPHILDAKN